MGKPSIKPDSGHDNGKRSESRGVVDTANPVRHDAKNAAHDVDNGVAARFRLVNAVVAAVITVAFLGHALLASKFTEGAVSPDSPIMTVLWLLFALVLAHAALSVVTTVFMFTDTVRPPSYRKKRHQVLKWATGVVLLAVMAIHIAKPSFGFPFSLIASLAIVAALTWHGWTGLKSLARDLNLRTGAKKPLRIVLCATAFIIVLILVVGCGCRAC